MTNPIITVPYYTALLLLAFWPGGLTIFLARKKKAKPKTIIALVIFQILWLSGLGLLLLWVIAYLIDKTA